jgi:hypothetical protein
LSIRLAKLPLFAGDGKDQFTAEQWIERVSRACTASAWTAVQTSTFVYNAFRGTALLWYDSLRRTGINRDDRDQFRAAFLESWSTVRTTRTATVNLADLKQGQNEAVTAFYPRVVKAVDDLEALVPGNAFPLPATIWPDTFTGVDAFMAITAANRTAAANALVAHGATSAFNHMALNLFISNLRPALRDELLKLQPDNLYNAFQQAIQLERLAVDHKRATLPAMPVEATSDPSAPPVPAATDDSSPDDLDKEIDALNFKLRSLKNHRDQRQGQPRNSSLVPAAPMVLLAALRPLATPSATTVTKKVTIKSIVAHANVMVPHLFALPATLVPHGLYRPLSPTHSSLRTHSSGQSISIL